MKSTRVLLNIMSVVGFIYGALYCFSLVFIPIGVYCFIAARRFSYKAEHLFEDVQVSNKTIKNFTIFVCVACFPFGFLAIIPCYKLLTNNIKISGFNYTDTRDTVPESEIKIETIKEEKTEVIVEDEKKDIPVQETEEEKLEKFEKLKNFNKKGIITDDELEMARKQLFGDSEK